MGKLRLDAAEVRELAQRVLDGADVLDEICCSAAVSAELPDSATGPATAARGMDDRIADVVARMRTWAAAAQSAATGLQEADARRATRLWQQR